MAPIRLIPRATERGDYPLLLTFTDSRTGEAVVLNAGGTWTLHKLDGEVINGKADQPILSSGFLLLAGADLAIEEEEVVTRYGEQLVERRLTIKATYNSEDWGDNISLTREYAFLIQPLTIVT